LKIFGRWYPLNDMGDAPRVQRRSIALRDASLSASASRQAAFDFASLYDAWFDDVLRWIRALGAPMADAEDVAQETFLVVRRRLGDFDGRNVAGWLYRIASRQVLQHRRRRWIKNVFGSADGTDLEQLPSLVPNAQTTLELKEKHQVLTHVLHRMSEKRRVAFVLFEIEGYSGEEISDILNVPINTVWTRLHHARREFYDKLVQYRRTKRGD
jgi:RNA polymerase sigma-70 factor, ECF subfamily